ncbi:MAG: prepilin-type N-terminal cleavage/methylation domain-containing protein [Elusimicrobiaceae bacterium]|nr:prepilin-type N-terminal cleavage/methylation domain-containing protein [Elusimicrobiaceae bacterium]
MKKGFTLIELLVVVLIIGILSSIALPQYQKAVARTKVVKGFAVLDAITKAQEVYYLANGEYTTDMEELDIVVPYTSKEGTEYNMKYKGTPIGLFRLHKDGWIFWSTGLNMTVNWSKNSKTCYADKNDTFAQKLCASFGPDTGRKDDANGTSLYEIKF